MMKNKLKFNKKIQFFKNLLILKMIADCQKIKEIFIVKLRIRMD